MDNNQYAQSGRIMFIITWIFFFFLLFVFFHYSDSSTKSTYQIQNGILTIKADSSGHYRIKGSINNENVEFIIDTGATLVAIPKSLANRLGLKSGYPILLQTANGDISGSLTRIKQLTFANFKLYDVKAVIMPGSNDNMILLGMNVLSKFNLSQQNNRLIIKK
ncbi:retropepsin-like aspartic protease family protein [Legionella gresilensis]|uniref:retropepsin-like aspartic protease family protein n=1 Tax=Legionella gresilensis TaxID=91823 RepID=UPI001F5F5AE4|nr:retropepsin-like aspartic protease [Legionella gresilensis]